MSRRFALRKIDISRIQIYCMFSLSANLLESKTGILQTDFSKFLQTGEIDPKSIIGICGLLSAVMGLTPARDPISRPPTKNPFKFVWHKLTDFIQKDTPRACALAYSPAAVMWFVEAAKAHSVSLLAVAAIGGVGTIAIGLPKNRFPKKVAFAGILFTVSSAFVVVGGIANDDNTHTIAGTLYTIGSIVAAGATVPKLIADPVKRNPLIMSITESLSGLTGGNFVQASHGLTSLVRQFKKPAYPFSSSFPVPAPISL
jgi:hypothetical protein